MSNNKLTISSGSPSAKTQKEKPCYIVRSVVGKRGGAGCSKWFEFNDESGVAVPFESNRNKEMAARLRAESRALEAKNPEDYPSLVGYLNGSKNDYHSASKDYDRLLRDTIKKLNKDGNDPFRFEVLSWEEGDNNAIATWTDTGELMFKPQTDIDFAELESRSSTQQSSDSSDGFDRKDTKSSNFSELESGFNRWRNSFIRSNKSDSSLWESHSSNARPTAVA